MSGRGKKRGKRIAIKLMLLGQTAAQSEVIADEIIIRGYQYPWLAQNPSGLWMMFRIKPEFGYCARPTAGRGWHAKHTHHEYRITKLISVPLMPKCVIPLHETEIFDTRKWR
jgi:hypothetical protein